MLVVGQKEMDDGAVNVRYRDGRQSVMKTGEFISYLHNKVECRSLEL
jgi:threonyl-tRNA synthetase